MTQSTIAQTTTKRNYLKPQRNTSCPRCKHPSAYCVDLSPDGKQLISCNVCSIRHEEKLFTWLQRQGLINNKDVNPIHAELEELFEMIEPRLTMQELVLYQAHHRAAHRARSREYHLSNRAAQRETGYSAGMIVKLQQALMTKRILVLDNPGQRYVKAGTAPAKGKAATWILLKANIHEHSYTSTKVSEKKDASSGIRMLTKVVVENSHLYQGGKKQAYLDAAFVFTKVLRKSGEVWRFMLGAEEVSLASIRTHFDFTQQAAARHLSKLGELGLVARVSHGKYIAFTLNNILLADLVARFGLDTRQAYLHSHHKAECDKVKELNTTPEVGNSDIDKAFSTNEQEELQGQRQRLPIGGQPATERPNPPLHAGGRADAGMVTLSLDEVSPEQSGLGPQRETQAGAEPQNQKQGDINHRDTGSPDWKPRIRKTKIHCHQCGSPTQNGRLMCESCLSSNQAERQVERYLTLIN